MTSKSSTITEVVPIRFDPPIHPGEILREQFLDPLGLSAGALARELGVPRTRIERIVREEIGISPDTALRLAKYLGTTPHVWVNMQAAYDLAVNAAAIGNDLDAIAPRETAPADRARAGLDPDLPIGVGVAERQMLAFHAVDDARADVLGVDHVRHQLLIGVADEKVGPRHGAARCGLQHIDDVVDCAGIEAERRLDRRVPQLHPGGKTSIDSSVGT